MTAGDAALAGDAGDVRDVGSDMRGRMFGTDVGAKLIEAIAGFGQQSGNAVSIDRTVAMIQAALAPADLITLADQAWGDAAETLGVQMEDIATRAKSERVTLEEAKAAEIIAQDAVDAFESTGDAHDDAAARRSLVGASDQAGDDIAASTQRLTALDEERRGADTTAATSLNTAASQYVAARTAMPNAPTLSAGVAVSVSLPDGTTQSVTAVDIAELKDPAAIRTLWDAMTPEQRNTLIYDFPMLIGNLEGIPLRDRNTANRITAVAHRTQLEKQIEMLTLLREQGAREDLAPLIEEMRGEVKSIDAMLGDRNGEHADEKDASGQRFGEYRVYDQNGTPSTQKGATVVGFSPFRDSYITYQGALDPVSGDVPSWMNDVGVLIPGTTSRLANFTADIDRSKDLFAQSGARSGYFTWHGAPMPQFDLDHIDEASRRGFADTAAPRLAVFANSLAVPPGCDVVPIAHSFGAAVLGGAEYRGLEADRVVYVAPAGLGHHVDGIEDFPNTKDVPHFVLQARYDAIVGWNQGHSGLGRGHGATNPLAADGVIRLETGYLDRDDPEAGTIESKGEIESHSTVFAPRSTSMLNIANVVVGEPVSLYHPDDTYLSQGRVPRRYPDFDSGVEKPQEYISPVTLEEVE